jgi:hypothetical protein
LCFLVLCSVLLLCCSSITIPDNKPITHINRFAQLATLRQFPPRLPYIGCKPYVEPFFTLDKPCKEIAVTKSNTSLYPISIPSHFQPFETLTQRCFGKTIITFAYELEIGLIFFTGIYKKFPIQFSLALPGLEKFRLAKFDFYDCLSELSSFWKICAKNYRNSIGPTLCLIELKIGVIPI